MSTEPSRTVRADARHNRAQVLAAARRAFAERGIEVTTRDIARRAGLGVATVYRHFPTREALLGAAFTEQVAQCSGIVAAAAADPDPWRGLCAVIDEVCTRQALDRAFTAALLGSTATARLFSAERAQNARGLTHLVERARRSGDLRPDVTTDDLRLVLSAVSGVTAPTREQALVEVRRLAALLLHGMRAMPAAPPPLPPRRPGPPVDPEALVRTAVLPPSPQSLRRPARQPPRPGTGRQR